MAKYVSLLIYQFIEVSSIIFYFKSKRLKILKYALCTAFANHVKIYLDLFNILEAYLDLFNFTPTFFKPYIFKCNN